MRKFIEQDRKNIINILVKSFKGNKSVDFVVGKSPKGKEILMEYSLENCLENGDVYIMLLLDPNTGRRESIIPFPENSIFRNGNFFFRDAWDPVFHISDNKLYIVFGLEPVIYIYENKAPFNLISSIPLELPNYHPFKGSEKYNSDDVSFIAQKLTSGKISNIKYVDNYFLLTYFPGFDAADTEMSISANIGPDFWIEMWKKYPTRIAILDLQGQVLNDFVPDEVYETTMIVRNGELWMMGKPDGEVELDYIQLFKIGLKRMFN